MSLAHFVLYRNGMTWIPRPLGQNLCYHVRMQCNNRAFHFTDDADFERYIDILDECRLRLGFYLHHYVIMNTHVHLMITTPGPSLLNHVMQQLNRRYALDHHRRHLRSGHFWLNGYRCSVIDTDSYALACMRYIARNPVRAGIVKIPTDWQWSSHRYYTHGDSKITLTPHPTYLGLARTALKRCELYQQFVNSLQPGDEAREIEMIRLGIQRRTPNNR